MSTKCERSERFCSAVTSWHGANGRTDGVRLRCVKRKAANVGLLVWLHKLWNRHMCFFLYCYYFWWTKDCHTYAADEVRFARVVMSGSRRLNGCISTSDHIELIRRLRHYFTTLVDLYNTHAQLVLLCVDGAAMNPMHNTVQVPWPSEIRTLKMSCASLLLCMLCIDCGVTPAEFTRCVKIISMQCAHTVTVG